MTVKNIDIVKQVIKSGRAVVFEGMYLFTKTIKKISHLEPNDTQELKCAIGIVDNVTYTIYLIDLKSKDRVWCIWVVGKRNRYRGHFNHVELSNKLNNQEVNEKSQTMLNK